MKKWILRALIGVVAVGLSGCGSSDAPAAPADAPADAAPAATEEPAATEAPAGVTLAQFEAIPSGSSYDEVVALIGPPAATMSESELAGIKTVMYQWKGAAFASNMTAMFQDGKLLSKSQFGLK